MLWGTTIAVTAGYKAPILIASTCQGHMLWDNTIAATAGFMAAVLIASTCLGSHAVGHHYSCYSWLHGCPALQPEQCGQHGQRGHTPARAGGIVLIKVMKN